MKITFAWEVSEPELFCVCICVLVAFGAARFEDYRVFCSNPQQWLRREVGKGSGSQQLG